MKHTDTINPLHTDLKTNSSMPNGSATSVAAFSPLYQQIKSLILLNLNSGVWKPGDAIPSELDLASSFGVSQGTVRKAIDELAAEKVLIRRQGKGTFVATHQTQEVRYRFFRLMADEVVDQKIRALTHFLSCQLVPAPADIAKYFQLEEGEGSEVLLLQRVLYFNDVPTVYEDIWLLSSVFKGLTLADLQNNSLPLYGFFEAEFGISMIRADEKIRAIGASKTVAKYLQVKPNTPLLQVERMAYTYGQKPVEIRQAQYLTSHYHYRNSLN